LLSILIQDGRHIIGRTLTRGQERKNGLMRYLINYFVKNIDVLYSDYNQTSLAKDMWNSIILNPGMLQFFYYNIETKSKTKIQVDQNNNIHPNPWNDKDNVCILIEKRKLSESAQKFHNLKEKYFSNENTWNDD